MVNTFRPCKNSLTATVKKNWPVLGLSKTTKEMYSSNVVTSYKRPDNPRDYLVRARTDYSPNSQSNNTPTGTDNECKKTNCKYCSMLNKSGSILNHISHKQLCAKNNISCNSSNRIYCLACKCCNKQYVGQTKRKIKDRLREHLYNIKKEVHPSDVSYHFNLEGHGIENLEVYIVDFIYDHPESKRAQKLRNTIEFNWIHRLQSNAPKGLNTLDNRYG